MENEVLIAIGMKSKKKEPVLSWYKWTFVVGLYQVPANELNVILSGFGFRFAF